MCSSAQFQVLQQEFHTAKQVMTTELLLSYRDVYKHYPLDIDGQTIGNGSGFCITN